ncbi:hypothetical protein V1504DRAFT_464348 [Lipomyces starkeyi]
MAWRIPVVTQDLFPSVLRLIGIPFLPESPDWLVFKGKLDEAAQSLRVFNGNDYDTIEQLQFSRLRWRKQNTPKKRMPDG